VTCTGALCCLQPCWLPAWWSLLGLFLQVDWMEAAMPHYPPTVNDGNTFQFAMDVAERYVTASLGLRHGLCRH
jgi:hypothetical protein